MGGSVYGRLGALWTGQLVYPGSIALIEIHST